MILNGSNSLYEQKYKWFLPSGEYTKPSTSPTTSFGLTNYPGDRTVALQVLGLNGVWSDWVYKSNIHCP